MFYQCVPVGALHKCKYSSNAWIWKTLYFINMNQFHSRFLTAGNSVVEITGWGLPKIVSEVTPTSSNNMDSE